LDSKTQHLDDFTLHVAIGNSPRQPICLIFWLIVNNLNTNRILSYNLWPMANFLGVPFS